MQFFNNIFFAFKQYPRKRNINNNNDTIINIAKNIDINDY